MSDFEIYILREQTPALGIGAGTYTKGRGPNGIYAMDNSGKCLKIKQSEDKNQGHRHIIISLHRIANESGTGNSIVIC